MPEGAVVSTSDDSSPSAAATAEAEVSIVNLSKTFPGTKALDGVSVTINRGEVHGLVGQNGSGKSTLIKILAGYHEPDPGSEIYVEGRQVNARRGLSGAEPGLRFVHQGLGLVDEFNAVDNIAMAGGYITRRGHIQWDLQARRTRELLTTVGVEVDIWRPVAGFEAVERTAVAIARALAAGTPGRGLLVLDEPTVALSPSEIQRLLGIVRGLADSGVAVLYVSHYLDEVLQIAQRVTVLRNGKLVTSRSAAGLDKRELVRLMIGGDIESTAAVPGTAARPGDGQQASVPALSVRDLYGHELRGVNFDVGRGEILGIAGTLGSGRTELPLALVGATDRVTCEMVVGEGQPLPRRRTTRGMKDLGVALVPSDRHRQGSIAEFTVTENLTLAKLGSFRLRGRLRHARERDYTARWLTELDVRPPRPELSFASLSGGNQQKVVLGKWLGTEPKVLILDEPTSGVDVEARATIYGIIRAQAAAGLAIVICSSDTEELVELASRVLVLRGGVVAAELTAPSLDEAAILHAMESEDAAV
jgi:ribose transport system ATP-binding protein